MKLISMVDYTLGLYKVIKAIPFKRKVVDYANLLNRKLELGMFVPCVDGVPFEEPLSEDYVDTEDNKTGSYDSEKYERDLEQYQEAELKVLFKGFEFIMLGVHRHEKVFKHEDRYELRIDFTSANIESLIKLNLELTENTIKQLEL